MKRLWQSSLPCLLLMATLMGCARHKGPGPMLEGRELEKQGQYTAALSHYQKNIKDAEFRETCIHNLYYLYGDILNAMHAINATPSPSAAQYYQLGQAYYDKAASYPDETAFLGNMTMDLQAYSLQERSRQQERALSAVNTAVGMQPNLADASLLQGILYEEQGEPDKAIGVYQQLLIHGFEQAQVYYRLAPLLYDRGETELALDVAQQGVAQFSADAQAHLVLGNLYAYEGRDEEAIDAYRRALCADPHLVEGYYRIVQYYFGHNQLIDVERVLKLAVANNQDSAPLSQFYLSVVAIVDKQHLETASQIFNEFNGDPGTENIMLLNIAEQSPALQLQYYDLQMQLVQRQRPYRLPCEAEQENPYFETLLRKTRGEMNKILAQLQHPEREQTETP